VAAPAAAGLTTPVYEAHGVDDKFGVFPVTIIEAATEADAIRKAEQDEQLRGYWCPIKLFQVPFYHTGLRAWREDELRFVADVRFFR
jgi:hypothetical protein